MDINWTKAFWLLLSLGGANGISYECVCERPGAFQPQKTSQIQFHQAFLANRELEAVCLSGRCIDLSKLLLALLTWLLLSDLPPHRFPDVCRLRALTCRLGNRFLFRQSWRRWFSQCWPGRWTSPPCRCSLLSDCRDHHTWKVGQNLPVYLPVYYTYFEKHVPYI